MTKERLDQLKSKIEKGGPLPSHWPDTTVLELIAEIERLNKALEQVWNTDIDSIPKDRYVLVRDGTGFKYTVIGWFEGEGRFRNQFWPHDMQYVTGWMDIPKENA